MSASPPTHGASGEPAAVHRVTWSGRTATPPATAWCRSPSPCRCRTTSAPRAPPLQLAAQDGHRARRWWSTPSAMGPDFTFFVVYGPVQPPGRPRRGAGDRARVPAAHRQGGQRRRSSAGCGASWSWSARASAPTRTPSASTPSSTSRASPARRAWSTTARCGWSTSAPRCSCPELVERARGRAGRRRAGLARSSPSATRTCTTPARCRPRSARRYPAERRPLRCWSSAVRASTSRRPPSSASTGSSAGAPPRRGRQLPRPRAAADPAERARRGDGPGSDGMTGRADRAPTPGSG